MVELADEGQIIALFRLPESGRFLVAGSNGRGLAIEAADLASEKRTGRQVLNLKPGERAVACVPAIGDRVAVLGENRKLLVFPLEQVAVLARGTGTTLQRYKEGGLKAVRVFESASGLVWQEGAKPRPASDLLSFTGSRGEAGKLAPRWLPQG
jgi:topoisomerase-4 subunit A